MNKESIAELLKEHGFKRIEVSHPTNRHAFQIVGYKQRRGLSIIAGAGMYSDPRHVTDRYDAVEVGLLVNGSLRYCMGNAPFFAGDVEGYVGEVKLDKIAASIRSLPLT